MKKVMVFGTFDGLHEGHRAMLKEAKALGGYLFAVVAQDHIVMHLKGHLPQRNFSDRFEHLEKADGVDKVVIGDAEIGTWNIVKRHKPEVIGIGHDQHMLKSDLEFQIKNKKLGYKPEIVMLHYVEVDKHE